MYIYHTFVHILFFQNIPHSRRAAPRGPEVLAPLRNFRPAKPQLVRAEDPGDEARRRASNPRRIRRAGVSRGSDTPRRGR
jgi:hypothetical protein